jgi:hypothetical protein
VQYQGRELADRFLAAVVFRQGKIFRLAATRANGQPAFGMYVRDPRVKIAHANGEMVSAFAGGQISAMTRFDISVLPRFGLPRTLPDRARARGTAPELAVLCRSVTANSQSTGSKIFGSDMRALDRYDKTELIIASAASDIQASV